MSLPFKAPFATQDGFRRGATVPWFAATSAGGGIAPINASSDGSELVGLMWAGTVWAGGEGDTLERVSAWRFTNVPIAQGRVVATAEISVTVSSSVGSTTFSLAGQDVDTGPALGDSNYPTMWTLTSATTPVPVTGGSGPVTYNVKAIVNEILARPGWAINGAMNFRVRDLAWSDTNVNIKYAKNTAVLTYTLEPVEPGGALQWDDYGYIRWDNDTVIEMV